MLSTGLAPAGGWRGLRLAGVWLAGAALLAACTTPSKAPVVDMSPSAPPASTPTDSSQASYVVRPGDTLYSIARAHNATWQDIATWNNITDPSQLRVGQPLRVGPAGAAPQPAAPTPGAVAQVEPIGGRGVQQRPLEGGPATPPSGGQPPAATPGTPPPSTPRAANTSGIDWLWPANGKIVSPFNESLNKGVDIEGTVGDPVVAAADGVVVYSGSGLRGYGNLIIVRHNASFLSAYAHNSKLLAKEGQNVRRGEKIAELGQSDAPSPRLHFEIRRGGTPEDPMQYLPQR